MDIVTLIIIAIFLIGLMSANRKVEEEESYMAIKFFVFYIVGLLSFTVKGFIIPIGLIVFFLIRPKLKNKRAKTFMALLGFAVLLINTVVPAIGNLF